MECGGPKEAVYKFIDRNDAVHLLLRDYHADVLGFSTFEIKTIAKSLTYAKQAFRARFGIHFPSYRRIRTPTVEIAE